MSRAHLRLALAGLSSALVAFGFGRFAYTALLPPMRIDLGMSYAAAGALASANLLSYLAGAFVTGLVMRHVSPARLLVGSMLLAAVPLALLGLVPSYPVLLGAMALLGFVSAGAWISVVALVTATGAPNRRGALLGVAGLGAAWGIPAVAGLTALLGTGADPTRWRAAWLVLAVTTASLGVLAWWLLRAAPLAPARAPGTAAGTPGRRTPGARLIVGVYAVYGFGYSIFVTFLVAFLGQYTSSGGAAGIWALTGLAAGAGALVIGGASDRFGRRAVLCSALLCIGLATALPLVSTSLPALILSAAGFGFPFVGVGTVVAAYVGDLHPDAAASGKLFATATIAFGLGQAAGPAVAGPLADGAGSFDLPFLVSCAALLLAAAAASRLPAPPD